MNVLEGLGGKLLLAGVLGVCGLVPLALPSGADASVARAAPEWPTQWEGHALRPLALSAVETRFASRFPGHIARLTDGEQVLVLREVRQPTRMLHPAADCYRALGYRIEKVRLQRDEKGRMWRCFDAVRPVGSGEPSGSGVCERIVDAQGQAFTDTSAWYWAGLAGRSTGPWQAVTLAQPL